MEKAIKLDHIPYDLMYTDMVQRLQDIQEAEINLVRKFQQCAEVCKQTLQQLKEKMLTNPFTNEEEEISFFKFIKPKFYSQLIYFDELHNIALRRPSGTKAVQEDFLTMEYYRIKFTFDRDVDLYHYYRNEETYLDEQFYLRKKKIINKSRYCVYLDEDPVFSTGYDYMIARFMAYELIGNYINEAINQLNNLDGYSNKVNKSNLTWTAKKADLAELVYLLYASKSINNGNIGKGELAEVIFGIFNLPPPNISKMGEELRIRKKGRREFINSAIEDYDKLMDKEDEKAF